MNWHPQVNGLLQNQSGQNLKAFLRQEKQARKVIFPNSSNWFKAFELTPFNAVKVVILGQDPYHNDGQAHGLSFSVPNGVTIPPSLRNIYTELQSDLGLTPNNSGNLEHWAKQGVLLLNSVLTVEKNSPGSHAQSGWVDFTDGVIDIINTEKQNLVFLLWGAYAYKKAALIDNNKHLVLTATHPSPFSAHRGFFGCKHFSKANKYLKMHQLKQINW
ncbi:Uracil-DNA glycosylase, family 1 (EC 3.2.2.27) [uncultured Gammaproteobacteria bacterium]|nr:Uracil-DNA glycosylase, family 1 (EC 3.2.2.27) [uncultured Gammaproteobacteria bacterium]SHN90964.1 Uracil-DNA glycosylase, family 1 [bacterium endosymbiont of Bathymodiolus sp. 5 South]CAC9645558.1 Uracil-DNA glycosylase, family 1 (EC 3.2.2.27) [uncultured Gammaproteobacteria bacterium]CAC9659370.1 Uracil-DNA glycosylase, family 1 (EC 3.2.2.27) [uncultured Gammaproteobacteria bacterium]SSC07888.1 Uracil-DNA glycosylase, family 1 [bacterium endosymbiont of Bathymodiolus sp. 5 South]